MKVKGSSMRWLTYQVTLLMSIQLCQQQQQLDHPTTEDIIQHIRQTTIRGVIKHDILPPSTALQSPSQTPNLPPTDGSQLTEQNIGQSSALIDNGVIKEEDEDSSDSGSGNGSGYEEIQAEMSDAAQIQVTQDSEILDESDSDETFSANESTVFNVTTKATTITTEDNSTLINSRNTGNVTYTPESAATTVPFTIEKRLQQIGKIEDIVKIESSTSKLEQIAKYGIYIEKIQDVTTHLTYIKLYIPLSVEIYYEEIQKATEILHKTANSLTESTRQLNEYINSYINTEYTNAVILSFCNLDQNMDVTIPDISLEEQRTVCRAMTAVINIQHLQDRTKDLFDDTIYRVTKIQEEIEKINTYMPENLQHNISQRSDRYNRDTETDARREADEFDLFSNGVSAILGLATNYDIEKVKISLLDHNKAILQAIQINEKSALVLDVQSMQMTNIATAVRNLQTLQAETTKSILSKSLSDNIAELVQISHLNLATAATVYAQINNILTDITAKIEKVKSGFQAATIRRLSIHTVDPVTLMNILAEFENTLKPHQKLLWNLQSADPTSYYNQIQTDIEPGTKNVICMVTFNIPIVEEKRKYTHYHISSIPFALFENKATYKTEMQGLPSSVEVLISDSSVDNKTKMYQVSEKAIIKAYGNNVAATLNTEKLMLLSDAQEQCVTVLINSEVDKIPSKCRIQPSSVKQQFLKASCSTYIYFSSTPTTVNIKCPSTPQINGLIVHETAELELHIRNFGVITMDPRCDMITTTTRFIGDPVTIEHRLMNIQQTKDNRVTNFRTLNISMWLLILNQEQKMQIKDMRRIIKEIRTVTKEFQPTLLERVNAELRERVNNDIYRAKSTIQAALEKIMDIGRGNKYTFIIQIVMAFILLVVVVWIVSKLNICFGKTKWYPAKYAKTMQQSKDEDTELIEVYNVKENHVSEGVYRKLTRYVDTATEDNSDDEAPPVQFYSETIDEGLTTTYRKWSTND